MASWVESLKLYNAKHAATPAPSQHQQHRRRYTADDATIAAREHIEEQERLVQAELRLLYRGTDQAAAAATSSASRPDRDEIPRFFVKRTTSPPPPDAEASDNGAEPPSPPPPSLANQLRREARTRYLMTRADQLFDERELALLWETIQLNSVDTNTETGAVTTPQHPPGSVNFAYAIAQGFESEKRLTYDSFLIIAQSLPSVKSNQFFKPSVFLSFPQDEHGRISSRSLWRYVTKKIQITRLRISLSCYDDVGYSFVREQDLENYVFDQLAALQSLHVLESDFYPYYVFTAVRKFIFFLDPHRRGKLRIKNVAESAVMLEFDALRFPHGHQQSTKKNSWFSAQHTQDVYAIYLGLDTNQNGMLSREEFRSYNGGNLTHIFIEGLFSNYRTYPTNAGKKGSNDEQVDPELDTGTLEMDYKTFLDFILAMEYKTTASSISYFFKILDINQKGYLDTATLNYWFRAVSEKMAALGHEQIDVADVVASEIFDMVSPKIPGRITLVDLISSRCGHTVIQILIDVNGFWKYDNRETLMHTDEDDN